MRHDKSLNKPDVNYRLHREMMCLSYVFLRTLLASAGIFWFNKEMMTPCGSAGNGEAWRNFFFLYDF